MVHASADTHMEDILTVRALNPRRSMKPLRRTEKLHGN